MIELVIKSQILAIRFFLGIFLLILFHEYRNPQEWLPWSSWEKVIGYELIYRQRIKYTTSDTYAVQVEWENQSRSDVHIEFEVRDKRNIKELKKIKVPSGTTKVLIGGTSFKSDEIRIKSLNIDFLSKDK